MANIFVGPGTTSSSTISSGLIVTVFSEGTIRAFKIGGGISNVHGVANGSPVTSQSIEAVHFSGQSIAPIFGDCGTEIVYTGALKSPQVAIGKLG